MIDFNEPCDCGFRTRHIKGMHYRAGKAAGKIALDSGQALEAVEKAHQFLAAHPEIKREACRKGGLAGGSKGGRAESSRESKRRNGLINGPIQGRKNVESGHISRMHDLPQSKAAYGATARRVGRENVESGRLAQARLLRLGRKPTWPEIRLYGLVLGNPITTRGFSAQQFDGHGIYDGAWLAQHIVAELDGGGHHAFKDRHADDMRKDVARLLDGNMVLREEDESVLFLKAFAILTEETEKLARRQA